MAEAICLPISNWDFQSLRRFSLSTRVLISIKLDSIIKNFWWEFLNWINPI